MSAKVQVLKPDGTRQPAYGFVREYRDADGGAIEVERVDASVEVVCGWCGGPVGSSGECERGCEKARQERRG